MQLPIIIFKNRLFRTCIIVKRTCISIFSIIGLVDQSKLCTQIYLQKKCKLHKFVVCNYNFKKSRLSDMYHPLRNIQANFEMNRQTRYQITAKRNYWHRRTDGQTDGQTTIGSFFRKMRKLVKINVTSYK